MPRPKHTYKRYRRPAKPRSAGGSKTPRHFTRIKAGADASLRNIFGRIGTPKQRPFRPDPFQEAAVRAVEKSDCLVSAPTGSGKTWIAVQAIARAREAGLRAWYASPLKALSNSKYAEFSEIYGPESVGILTGDRKENVDAPVIVGTTEILRNQLYDAMYRGEQMDTDFVVIDEAHFLGDPDRGVVWEETLIYLPQRIPLLLLSATIGNADQIAKWLQEIRSRPCTVVREEKRPVPLIPLFFHPSGTLLPLTDAGAAAKGRGKLHKKVRSYLNRKPVQLLAPPRLLPPFGEILRVMRRYRLLPALFFLKSRADCDRALDKCEGNRSASDSDRDERRRRRVADLLDANPHVADHRQRRHLEENAVGSHHSGQLPAWKLVLETLMTEGLLDAVFATSTVAAGVNFPARTVGFLNSDRYNGREFLPLDATEFHQMTGRAGRRGMDHIGFALALPGKHMDLHQVARLSAATPADVRSQIRINFSMVLNLLLSHSPGEIENLLRRSFAAFRMRGGGRSKGARKGAAQRASERMDFLVSDFRKHMGFLQECGYVTPDGRLTEDGEWASQLRVDQPLLIAEGFRKGLLPDTDPEAMAAVVASFVNEKETDDHSSRRVVPEALLHTYQRVRKGLRPFLQHQAARGFEVRQLYFKPAVIVYLWATGRPWSEVVSTGEMEEGDLVMLILRTADNLRHIRGLGEVFPSAADTAAEAVHLLLRDPVVEKPL